MPFSANQNKFSPISKKTNPFSYFTAAIMSLELKGNDTKEKKAELYIFRLGHMLAFSLFSVGRG